MKGISPKKMAQYMDTVFWYVFDESSKQVIAAPDTQSEGVAILFLQKEDAQRWMAIVSTAPAYKGIDLSVQGDKFRAIYEDSLDYPEFRVLPFGQKGAEEFFSHYKKVISSDGIISYKLSEQISQEEKDNRARYHVQEFRRSVTEVVKEDLLSEPKETTDAKDKLLWEFQIKPGIFNPRDEEYFLYDFDICIVELVEADDVVICRRIGEFNIA